MTHGRREIIRLLESVGATPSRALGQNFVVDPNTVRRIVELAGVAPGDRVVEIGAGLGSLTLALAEAGASVTAIESDRRLVEALRAVVAGRSAAGRSVTVVHDDATTMRWRDALGGVGGWNLVANLPYNIAAGLVVDTLDAVPEVERLLVMVQAEVGERLAAPLGTRACGITTAKVAFHARADVVGRVSAAVFHPRPRVDSVLVRIVRRPSPEVDKERFAAIVESGFGQRRKMIRSSLAGHLSTAEVVRRGVDPTARAEALTLDEWCRLAAS